MRAIHTSVKVDCICYGQETLELQMRRCMQDECNNEVDCREVDKKERERERENDMIQLRRIIDVRYICKFGTRNFITEPPTPSSCKRDV